jgi:hypothetical protein
MAALPRGEITSFCQDPNCDKQKDHVQTIRCPVEFKKSNELYICLRRDRITPAGGDYSWFLAQAIHDAPHSCTIQQWELDLQPADPHWRKGVMYRSNVRYAHQFLDRQGENKILSLYIGKVQSTTRLEQAMSGWNVYVDANLHNYSYEILSDCFVKEALKQLRSHNNHEWGSNESWVGGASANIEPTPDPGCRDTASIRLKIFEFRTSA